MEEVIKICPCPICLGLVFPSTFAFQSNNQQLHRSQTSRSQKENLPVVFIHARSSFPLSFPFGCISLVSEKIQSLFFLLEISTRLSEQQLRLGQDTWHSLQMVKCKQMSSAVSVTEFARIHSVPASVPMLSQFLYQLSKYSHYWRLKDNTTFF